MDTFKVDLRKIEVQTRQVRDGNALLFQYRNIVHNPDGSREYPDWVTSGTCTNYGDVFDKRPSWFERIMNWIKGD